MPVRGFDFVQSMFLSYYQKHFDDICIPSSIEKREFGASLFRDRIMIRHRHLETSEHLYSFLVSYAPSDVFYSGAYYERPGNNDMNSKDWLGADLIFDIDADHIATACDRVHDNWKCVQCSFEGKGVTPDRCPQCGAQKFLERTWPCETCLNSAKAETIKLLDILSEDFGLSEGEMHVYFSGHRGFHVHVEDESIRTLDAISRKEIVDYVCGIGLDFGSVNSRSSGRRAVDSGTIQNLSGPSWNKRVAESFRQFVLRAEEKDYMSMGLGKGIAKRMVSSRDRIVENMSKRQSLLTKGIGPQTLQRILPFCVQYASARIDTVVTTDTHRLIRLGGTLHSKTGLKKTEFPAAKTETFDPFRDAIVFDKGRITVSVSDAPKFRLGEEIFGPYKNQLVELPTAAAVLLICRNRAEVVD